MKHLARITFYWGLFTLAAIGFAHLALTDIYHASSGVKLEWSVVQIAALVVLVFIGLSLVSLRKLLKSHV